MASSKCTIKFLLKTDVDAHPVKGYPVYCRITCQRKKAHFTIGAFCKESNWEPNLGMPIKSPRLKEQIIHIESKLNEIKRQLDLNNEIVSAKIIRDIYKGKDKIGNAIPLMELISKHIQKLSAQVEEYSNGTVGHYETMKSHLLKFLSSRNEADILIQKFSRSHVEAFDDFLLTTSTQQYERPMGRNTANKYHKKLKTVLLNAVRKNIITASPYVGFKLKEKAVERRYLSKEDLNRLSVVDLGGNQSLEKVRDVFLFSCYTGLRFTDAQDLKEDDIVIDAEGRYWLQTQQQKTNAMVDVPMIEKAKEIYHYYDKERAITGRVLPKFSNPKVNVYLKIIAELAGVKQHLTHHVARHTFASTILLENDIPVETVQVFLGQKSIKSTMIYAKITKNKKLKTIDSLNEKL